MSQDDYSVANAPGATVRADINSQLSAIATNNSGSSAPSATFANMWWFDTANSLLKIRNNANTAWITVARKSSTAWFPYINGDELGGTAALDELGLALVSQVEAEAGTGTTARRWTAERVGQAIVALAPSVSGLTRTYGTGITLNPWATDQDLSASHGLGGYPDGVEAYLECLTTEYGWAVGDRVNLDGPQGSLPFVILVNSTTVYLRTSPSRIPNVLRQSDGASFNITSANWKAIVTPYVYA